MTNFPNIQEMCILLDKSLREAIGIIDKNAQGICFVVDEQGILRGILSDGDIRRALLKGITLDDKVQQAMYTNFTSLPIDAAITETQAALSNKITHIPLVDEKGVVLDYACIHRFRRIPVMEPSLANNELEYVTNCIQTNWISSQGKYVRQFEEMLATYCQMPYALAVSNGTVALHLALLAMGIGEGDEVIVPDLTFAATINAVLHANATPVIADVDPATWNIAPEQIEQLITPKTKAIIPVHLYGFMAAMDEIMAIAKKHDLRVIEDAAEALGSELNNQKSGSFGDASTFSFFGNKTITTGEGGMVLFKDKAHYDRACILRDHGMSRDKKYWHDMVGYNYRMTNLQAAIGVAQMENIDKIVAQKIKLAQQYTSTLKELSAYITLPPQHPNVLNTYWLYSVTINNQEGILSRDEIIKKLLANGIETRPIFYPLHQMPVYKKYAKATYPVSSAISEGGMCLPSYINLTISDITFICSKLASIFKINQLTKT
jgi:perosamine synthetase